MQFCTEEVKFIEDQRQLFSLKYRKKKLEEEVSTLEEKASLEDIGTKLNKKKTSLQKIEESIKKQEENLTRYKKVFQKGGIVSRIEKLARRYRLNQQERDVICYLLLSELGIDIGEKGSHRYSLSGRDILRSIIGNSTQELLRAWNYFSPEGKLIKKGLIIHHRLRPYLNDDYQLSNQTLTELLSEEKSEKKPRKKPEQEGFKFKEIILSQETRLQIESALAQIKYEEVLFKEWGLGKVMPQGRGICLLFWGPPGTGKTIIAYAIARKLRKKLKVINYAQILSMWFGNSEKNIVKAFEDAKREKAVLIFDEADALFSNRAVANNSGGKAYNACVNILLQEVEKFTGVLILTTNHETLLDPALDRRVVKIKFGLPESFEREKIWRLHLKKVPLDSTVDYRRLARDFPLTGGEIKQAVLIAVRRTVTRLKNQSRTRLTMSDLREAAEKVWHDARRYKEEYPIGFACPIEKDSEVNNLIKDSYENRR